jgi:hypothetical protein
MRLRLLRSTQGGWDRRSTPALPELSGIAPAARSLSAQAQLQAERREQRGQLLNLYGLLAGLPGRNLRLVRADTTR